MTLKLNANAINQTQGLKNMNKQILKAFVKEFSQMAPVTKTGGFMGFGAKTTGGQAALRASNKLRIPASVNELLTGGNKGWNLAAGSDTAKINSLLTKYPKNIYNWTNTLTALEAANIKNINELALKNAIKARKVNFI